MVAGPIVFFIGLFLIAWNEYRTVQTEKAIALGDEAMVEANCGSLGASGSLVLSACDLTRSAGAGPVAIPAPPALTQPWTSPATGSQVTAPASELGGSWATSADYSSVGIPSTAVPLILRSSIEVNGWTEIEHCQTRNSGSGSKTQTCEYEMQQQWITCGPDEDGCAALQDEGWRNTNPSQDTWAKMNANRNANRGGRYLPGKNPFSIGQGSLAEVYVDDAFLGTAYPLNEESISMIASRGAGEAAGSGRDQRMPTSCTATTPWSSASSYWANCEFEKRTTGSSECTTVQSQATTTCNPAAPAPPAPPTAPPGLCTTAVLPECYEIQVNSGLQLDQATCEAQAGCTFVPGGTGDNPGSSRCDTAPILACGTVAATEQACLARGSCTFTPPPQGGMAGTCFTAPVARNDRCCLDASTCDDYVSENAIGQRRVSFLTTYGSDATVAAQQQADGTFTKWVPEGVDESYSPWDYGSFGKKDRATVLQELYDENDLIKVLLRFFGWLLTWVGLQLLTGPLTIFPDIIPFVGPCIGDLMGAALCCVTLMVSLASSLFVGALAWIFVRPWLSLILIVICIALAAGTYYTRQNKGALTGEKAAASKSLPIAQSVPVAQCSPGMEVDVMVPPGCVPKTRLARFGDD